MIQLVATLVAFLFIPLLLRYKVKLSHTIAITALVLSLFSGIGLMPVLDTLAGVFRNRASLDTILTVFLVSLVGGAMKHYGMLDRIVDALLQMLRNRRTVLMVIPSLIGVLSIPGGAVLSAPFVDKIGQDAGLPPSRRAAVNLIFRHVAMLVFPFSTTILFVRTAMTPINIYVIILYNLVFMLLLLSYAYVRFLGSIETPLPPETSHDSRLKASLKQLFVNTAPIYVPVLLNAALGFPFSVSMLLSLVLVYFMSDQKHFMWVLKKSAGWDTVLIIISVLLMKNIILQMNGMLQVFDAIFALADSDLAMMGVFIVTSVFFGFITGNITAPLAMTLPMLMRVSDGAGMSLGHLHVFTYFLMISAFLGYYFSPLHLCQTFTLKLMKVSTGDLYRAYGVYVLVALGLLVATTLSLLTLVA